MDKLIGKMIEIESDLGLSVLSIKIRFCMSLEEKNYRIVMNIMRLTT
ncbi:hypothetical protein [Pseudalkalibacillus decolorationis]|nr:hypothetical protein [Pseudalkalibacillus decolorationis]